MSNADRLESDADFVQRVLMSCRTVAHLSMGGKVLDAFRNRCMMGEYGYDDPKGLDRMVRSLEVTEQRKRATLLPFRG